MVVVGPSGAGKDSLIAAARAKLCSDSRFAFPQRVITRRRDGSEDHIEVDVQSFAASERAGDFALSWSAHGLRYGISRSIEQTLASGRHVVVNASRKIVAEARERYAPSIVIEVTAQVETRAARLRARGREAESAIASRVERELDVKADFTIVNDGSLDSAAALFLAALAKVENSSPAP